MKVFKNLDFYGSEIKLYINEEEKFKTVLGSLFSLATVSFFIVFSILFGRPLAYKEDPNVIQSSETPSDSSLMIDNSLLKMAFRITDKGSDLRSLIRLNAFFYTNIPFSDDYEVVPIVNCTNNTDLTENLDINRENGIIQCYNISKSISMKGSSRFLFSVFRLCNSSDKYCNTTKAEEFRSGKYDDITIIRSFYLKYSFSNDYDEPLKSTSLFADQTLSYGKLYSNIYHYKNLIVDDDIGWIFKNKRKFSKISQEERIVSDTSTVNYPMHIKDYLFSNVIYLKEERIIFNRSYKKIQDIFAQIGGLMSFIQIVISLILVPISGYGKKLYIINKLFLLKNDYSKEASSKPFKYGSKQYSEVRLYDKGNGGIWRRSKYSKNCETKGFRR